MLINCRISPRRTCKPFGFTKKISSMGHRHLIYIVKRNTGRDGMGPFNLVPTQFFYDFKIASLNVLSMIRFILVKSLHCKM